MSESIGDLVVTLRTDAANTADQINRQVAAVEGLGAAAARTSAKLEQASKAWAAPQSKESLYQTEAAMMQAVAAKKAVVEKQMLQERIQRMQQEAEVAYAKDQQEFQQWRALQEEKNALDEQLFQEWRARQNREASDAATLNQAIFAGTHSHYEVQLAAANAHFNSLRAAHQGNAEMEVLIERAKNLEIDRINEEENERLRHKIFARRGPLMHSLKEGISATGMMSGGMIGYSGSMLMHMGLVGGGIASGMLLASEAIKTIREETKEVLKLQETYTKEVEKSALEWEFAAKGMTPTTEFGKEALAKMQQYQEEQSKVQAEISNRKSSQGYISSGYQAITGKEDPMVAAMNERNVQLRRSYAAASQLYDEHTERQAKYNAEDRKAALLSAQIGAMADGPGKQRSELLANLGDERRKQQQKNKEELAAFDAKTTMAKTEHKNAGWADWAMVDEDRKNAKERARIEEEGKQALANVDAVGDQKIIAQDRALHMQRLQDQSAYESARINATMTGAAKQAALTALKYTDALNAAEGDPEKQKLLEKQELLEVLSQESEKTKDLGRMQLDMQNKTAIATHTMTASTAEWQQMVMTLNEKYNLTKDQLDAIHTSFTRMKQAQADQPLADEMEDLNIELDLARHNLTELDAAWMRLRKSNPEASDGMIDQLAATKMQVEAQKLKDASKPATEQLADQINKIKDLHDQGSFGTGPDAEQAYTRAMLQATENSGMFQHVNDHGAMKEVTDAMDVRGLQQMGPTKEDKIEDVVAQLKTSNDILASILNAGGLHS